MMAKRSTLVVLWTLLLLWSTVTTILALPTPRVVSVATTSGVSSRGDAAAEEDDYEGTNDEPFYNQSRTTTTLSRPSLTQYNPNRVEEEGEEELKKDEALSLLSETIQRYFPGAVSNTDLLHRLLIPTLQAQGLTPSNTLFAESCCPDEINHSVTALPTRLANYFFQNQVFHLGGLGGIPFTGQTGMAAFLQHVPTDGHALILVAPHIGVCRDATSHHYSLGKYHRHGQQGRSTSTTCGAAIAAYHNCCNHDHGHDASHHHHHHHHHHYNEEDYQMSFLQEKIRQSLHQIRRRPQEQDTALVSNNDNNKNDDQQQHELARLARVTHAVATDYLQRILAKTVKRCLDQNSTVVVLSGIQINVADGDDFFLPLSLIVHHQDGTQQDLTDRVFGRTAIHEDEENKKEYEYNEEW